MLAICISKIFGRMFLNENGKLRYCNKTKLPALKNVYGNLINLESNGASSTSFIGSAVGLLHSSPHILFPAVETDYFKLSDLFSAHRTASLLAVPCGNTFEME